MSDTQHDSPQGEPSAEDTGTAEPGLLAQQLSELARTLQAQPDTGPMLDEVVAAAVQLIPGADEGSISVVIGRKQVFSQHPSSDLPRAVDAIQEEVGEGPCLDAVFEQQTVRVPDMAHEERWPRFAARAVEAGAASMLAFQLWVQGDNLGALNLFGRRANGFSDESEAVGLLFASHAAVAMAEAQKIDQLNRAVDSRDIIGQAKGILMERHHITADQAFRLLTMASQQRNKKLREVAEELAFSGQLTGISAPSKPASTAQAASSAAPKPAPSATPRPTPSAAPTPRRR